MEDIFLKLVKFITTLLAEVVILHLSNLKGGHSLKWRRGTQARKMPHQLSLIELVLLKPWKIIQARMYFFIWGNKVFLEEMSLLKWYEFNDIVFNERVACVIWYVYDMHLYDKLVDVYSMGYLYDIMT